ncbi:hypothetical protein HCN44_000313 [Aphidius gifuensis]|uniref:Uncharacterized protein n=1 Tax=Aphidius gifuensis TaxID=684658 RepID=A0A834XND4_APHGI|nr:hypothetical protein HCN44_000313 [Aphidius gifuensis]
MKKRNLSTDRLKQNSREVPGSYDNNLNFQTPYSSKNLNQSNGVEFKYNLHGRSSPTLPFPSSTMNRKSVVDEEIDNKIPTATPSKTPRISVPGLTASKTSTNNYTEIARLCSDQSTLSANLSDKARSSSSSKNRQKEEGEEPTPHLSSKYNKMKKRENTSFDVPPWKIQDIEEEKKIAIDQEIKKKI